MLKLTNCLISLLSLFTLLNQLDAKYLIDNDVVLTNSKENLKFHFKTNYKVNGYDFEKGWNQRTKDDRTDQILQFHFNEKIQISFQEHLNLKLKSFTVSFFYYLFGQDDKFNCIVKMPSVKADSITLLHNEWFEQSFSSSEMRNEDEDFKFTIDFFKLNEQKQEIQLDSIREKEQETEDKKYSIYIKHLKLKFVLDEEIDDEEMDVDEKIINEIEIYPSDDEFSALIDNQKVQKENLVNYLLLPELTSEITDYYYTLQQTSSSFNWSLNNQDQTFKEDICVEFKYQAAKSSSLKLKILNQLETSFFTLIDLDSSAFKDNKRKELVQEDQNLESTANEPRIVETTKWIKVSFCLRDLFSNSNKLQDFYKLKFESTIAKDKQFGFLALTDIKISERNYKQKTIKNYLTNWKTNGSLAVEEWFTLTGINY